MRRALWRQSYGYLVLQDSTIVCVVGGQVDCKSGIVRLSGHDVYSDTALWHGAYRHTHKVRK